MNFNDFLNCGKVNALMPQYQRKKREAVNLCCEMLEKYNAPYVALSGGKDSVAMAFIVSDAAKKTGKRFQLWTHISDASFPGTLETCKTVSEMTGMPLDVYQSKVSAFDAVKADKKQNFGKTGTFFDSVREYAADKDLCFVGVRARESRRRKKSSQVHGQIFYSASMGDITICHPLLWFKLEDVASVLYEYDAPIHPIYKKVSIDNRKNGLNEEQFIRLSYVTSKDLLNKGTAVFLKLNYPHLYNKLAEVYPEIRFWV